MFFNSSIDTGITIRGSGQKLSIRRYNDDHGFQHYLLENKTDRQAIVIPYYMLGKFRMVVDNFLKRYLEDKEELSFEGKVDFFEKEYFEFLICAHDKRYFDIIDKETPEFSTGFLRLKVALLPKLEELLYDERLGHPNDVLQRIISYHKLFQFTFVQGSKSLSSGLSTRKDRLQHEVVYTPKAAPRASVKEEIDSISQDDEEVEVDPDEVIPEDSDESAEYAPRLGERSNDKNIKVDYSSLFGDKEKKALMPKRTEEAHVKKLDEKSFYVPLDARDIKEFHVDRFEFELTQEDAQQFRGAFFTEREADYCLGFEIVDAIFKKGKQVKSFRFPLYYLPITIRESGRKISMGSANNGEYFLNHLALANLVEKFSSDGGLDSVPKFFSTLLAQDLIVDNINDRIHISRFLPVKESIFDRTREILFGYVDEKGKGGILDFLELEGFECDLHSIFLYRLDQSINPIEQALEHDLDQINQFAHQNPDEFYKSLLGKFLTPEKPTDADTKVFAEQTWMPGRPPKSTEKLVNNLNAHDLILLEGPPGTGKTHTIMNLFIQSVCSEKRVLIVSDQAAAVEALVEKVIEYMGAEGDATAQEALLHSAVKIIDDIPLHNINLPNFVNSIKDSMSINVTQPQAPSTVNFNAELEKVDKKLQNIQDQIDTQLKAVQEREIERIVNNTLTFEETKSLVEFLNICKGPDCEKIERFVAWREKIVDGELKDCYDFFKLDHLDIGDEISKLAHDRKFLDAVIRNKPKSSAEFDALANNHEVHEITRFLRAKMEEFEKSLKGIFGFFKKLWGKLRPPLQEPATVLVDAVKNQIDILKLKDQYEDAVWEALKGVHEDIKNNRENHAKYFLGIQTKKKSSFVKTIEKQLTEMDALYRARDEVVKGKFMNALHKIVYDAVGQGNKSGTSPYTTASALMKNLGAYKSIDNSANVWQELQQKLSEIFPIWVIRKQVAPFLLPCVRNSFDLVVVDEATQCRVDDSLSLLFRSDKFLVVGDDKQTVLEKNSPIDDYLFEDFELDEHLRTTQARGFKGGGSNIFSLVQSIKQSSVILDEHYRCPRDIIDYSNQFVYDSALRVMQWQTPASPPSLIVSDIEKEYETSKKPSSGKYKGTETEMIDRFFQFMIDEIKTIEKKEKRVVDLKTDVAICYFLLKNEPYVKAKKSIINSTLGKDGDILDGAGAALQGKERDFIFYLWDITRYNWAVFKQGDDPEKRKGELNVLMSRPKKCSYHYLHRSFDTLDHSQSSITQYLSMKLNRQSGTSKGSSLDRSYFAQLVDYSISNNRVRSLEQFSREWHERELCYDIIVGDPSKKVDIVLESFEPGKASLGVVNLHQFVYRQDAAYELIDYYFQLRRAKPKMQPVFILPEELFEHGDEVLRHLAERI